MSIYVSSCIDNNIEMHGMSVTRKHLRVFVTNPEERNTEQFDVRDEDDMLETLITMHFEPEDALAMGDLLTHMGPNVLRIIADLMQHRDAYLRIEA